VPRPDTLALIRAQVEVWPLPELRTALAAEVARQDQA
jgi:hypothetical protein